eukprot:12316.XXX_730581_733805_1 [CDS] Oithona nana genome sequencing.
MFVFLVGGGTAGCALAARLSEIADWKILLVEAGGEQPSKVKIPWFHLWLTDSPLDWKYVTEPQSNAMWAFEQQKSWWWRGKVIGGTGAINTMIYMRGNAKDYDHWAALGNAGWSFRDVLPYFIKLENMKDPNLAQASHHGTKGPMSVEKSRHTTWLLQAFLAAASTLGYPIRDPNGFQDQSGFSPYLFNIQNGQRASTADAYLRPALKRDNLDIVLNTHVRKILFDDNKRAIGIEATQNHGYSVFEVKASREVIVSAGTIVSPQLLLLSGIGDKSDLAQLGIPLITHLPGVGDNLQDHVASYGLTWTTKGSGNAYNPFLYTIDPRTYLNWKLARTGPLAAPIGVEGNAFVTSKWGNQSWPDLQITFIASHPGFDGGTVYKNFLRINTKVFDEYFVRNAFSEGYSLYPILLRPKSRGKISLRSSNPQDYPKIQPNYLTHPDDVKVLVEGLKMVRKIGDAPSFQDFGGKFFDQPFPLCTHLVPESDDYWECFVRSMTTTDHHPVGTCKMGHEFDAQAVVNPQNMNVYGVKNLRVVDASVMP